MVDPHQGAESQIYQVTLFYTHTARRAAMKTIGVPSINEDRHMVFDSEKEKKEVLKTCRQEMLEAQKVFDPAIFSVNALAKLA